MAPVLADARAAEVVRDDVTVTDLVTLASIVTRVPPSAREVDARIWERFLGLALDGLRPGAASVLPRAPLPAGCDGGGVAEGVAAPRRPSGAPHDPQMIFAA